MNNFHKNQLNIPIVNKLYYLYKKTHLFLQFFPKQERYSLGAKIQNCLLDMIESVFITNQIPKPLKETLLTKTNSKNEMLKLLYRLAYEMKVLDTKQYLYTEESCQETGKMIGGWIKYLKSNR